MDHGGLLVAKSLVDSSRREVPLRIMNLTKETQILHRNTSVAVGEPVTSIRPPVEDQSPSSSISELPEHLNDLYSRSIKHLNKSLR
jgi:hypothetical protein